MSVQKKIEKIEKLLNPGLKELPFIPVAPRDKEEARRLEEQLIEMGYDLSGGYVTVSLPVAQPDTSKQDQQQPETKEPIKRVDDSEIDV
jgi:hypothetical protein